MKRYTIHLLPLLVLVTQSAFAQNTFAVQYAINIPMGNTSDYIGTASFRGVSLDYRHHITPNVGVGIGTGWYTFYEKQDYGTYTSDDGSMSVTGIQYRYINSLPILFAGDYYFSPDEKFSPFVGLGIGVTYNEVNTEMGQFYVDIDTWHFTLAPEAGIRIGAMGSAWGFLSVRYNNNFETSDLDTQSYLTLNVGLMFGR